MQIAGFQTSIDLKSRVAFCWGKFVAISQYFQNLLLIWRDEAAFRLVLIQPIIQVINLYV